MTHRGPFQPLPFCDSVTAWCGAEACIDTVREQRRQRMRCRREVVWWYKTKQRLPSETPQVRTAHPWSVKEMQMRSWTKPLLGNEENKQQYLP